MARRLQPADPAQIGLLEAASADSRGIEVRESRRARRLALKVHPWGRVEVIVPHGTPPGRVWRFVHENQAWIERTRRVMGIDAALPAEAVPNDIAFPLTGEAFGVFWDRDPAGAPADLRRDPGRIRLRGSEPEVLASLRRWLLKHARHTLAPKLAALADETGLSYRRLQVRRQRTRWGSCSSSGTISLNGCLLFLTPAQARYLMIHELCHTRHMNHSAAFWSLVERFQPGARGLDREVSKAWRSIPAWVMSG